jgi:C-terminal processing protease CtpA/Prc
MTAGGTTQAPDQATGKGRGGLAAPFLADTAEPVRDQLAGSVELADFLRGAGTLTLAERKVLVEQALVLLEQNYVHLPLKAAMHAVNPVQRLRVLRTRLDRQTPDTMPPEWTFHAELSGIFHSLRDLHTNYLLPQPFNGKVAYLPFEIEEYFDAGGERRYVVTRMVQGFTAPWFGPGAEVTHWSGIPIDRAVELQAARFAGSNAAARHSRGLQSLTIRPLRIHLPPDEEWVTLGYTGLDGAGHELVQRWLVVDNLPAFVDPDAVSTAAAAMGMDLDGDETNRARKLLFVPQVVAQEQARAGAGGDTGGDTRGYTGTDAGTDTGTDTGDVATSMPGVFRARTVATPSGTFGHLRIFTFNVDDPDAFVREFVRLLGLLPPNGLILDVRGNGGGHIHASEFALQALTPRRIVPEPVQFVSTPLNLRICRKHKDNPTGQIDLGPWFGSIEQATETGAAFSSALPITPADGANAIGQRYCGPVVLVTDARCYSATDIFAAGFADHGIGTVLGVDDNTGAGGANVWTHALLKALLEVAPADTASPYAVLPKQANMRVSIRRTLRVGDQAGTPVEDLGVVPDERHRMTREDVLGGNVDLLARAGELLAAQPVRVLDVQAMPTPAGALRIDLEAANLDRADVYVDGRPRTSLDLTDGTTSISVPNAGAATALRVEGFAAGQLVAARALRL